jgi:hypothetical protein
MSSDRIGINELSINEFNPSQRMLARVFPCRHKLIDTQLGSSSRSAGLGKK